jgi:hypothetical protein
VAAVAALPARSCLIDGEAIVSDDSGLAVFELIRSFRHDHAAVLCAFDLLELDGEDLRRLPIEQRKQMLVRLLHGPYPGLALNEHYVGHGDIVYQQAWKLGCEGIVSKRLGSIYRSGRSKHWVKVKNPAAPAVRREAEEARKNGVEFANGRYARPAAGTTSTLRIYKTRRPLTPLVSSSRSMFRVCLMSSSVRRTMSRASFTDADIVSNSLSWESRCNFSSWGMMRSSAYRRERAWSLSHRRLGQSRSR